MTVLRPSWTILFFPFGNEERPELQFWFRCSGFIEEKNLIEESNMTITVFLVDHGSFLQLHILQKKTKGPALRFKLF